IDRAGVREHLNGVTGYSGLIGTMACDAYGDCSSSKITVIQNIDTGDYEASTANVVYEYAPLGSTQVGDIAAAAAGSGDQRLRPEEESGWVGVVSAENSQTGREVDFSVFAGKNVGIVRVLAVPEATIQTEMCVPTIEANGGSADVVDANFDTGAAIQAMETFLGRGDDAVWNVSNSGAALRPVIDQANAVGTPFVGTYTFDQPGSIDIKEHDWGTSPVLAQYIGSQMGAEGKLALAILPGIPTLDVRTHIIKSVIEFSYPNIEIVEFVGDGTIEGFRAATEAGMQANPDVKAIYSHWDVPAAGVLQALDDLGRDDVMVTSYTGDQVTGFQWLGEGKLIATVAQSNAQIGMVACEYLALAIAGEALPESTLVPESLLVTGDPIPGPNGAFNGPPFVLTPFNVTN
ncbi:MAG TPA: substrate-binding domain-containing protein, partial [Arenicellales bacterium]|nr:substrate-binding domain-containing protein [Arenicellales bacterium]